MMPDVPARIGIWAGAIISVAIIIGGIVTGVSKVSAMELATTEAMAVATANAIAIKEEQKKTKQAITILTQLAAQVNNIYKRGLVVQGKALVLEIGDTPYIELNTRDPNGPSRLSGFGHLHVMNLTHPDLFEGEMEIGGSFSNATPGYVMNISKAAGVILHAAPGTWIVVRAKPHFEENGVGKDD